MSALGYNQPIADPSLIACLHCDLLQRLPELAPGASARCARCDRELWRRREDSLNRTLALTLGAALLYIVANSVPMLGLTIVGRAASTTVIGGAEHLWQNGQQMVAVLVLLTAVVAPALQIGFMLAIVLGAHRERPPRWVGTLLRHHPTTRTWSVIEVMMLGVLVALVKIADYATVIPGVALFVLWVLVFLLAAMQSNFDPREVWERIRWRRPERGAKLPGTAWPKVRRECARSNRDATGPAELRDLRPALASRARRGGRALPPLRRGAGLSQAGKLPAHVGLPDCRGGLLHPGQRSSRIDDDHGRRGRVRHHPARRRVAVVADRMAAVADCVFASVMIPSAKILALAYLLITSQRGSIKNNAQRIRLYRMVEFIGRWSMVDVFVNTFTAALIQLQPLMSVEPGPGLFFFAGVVVLTMLAVESFDPRLIWDATRSKEVRYA